ncbi:hypothetical protein AB0M28_35875 [Streptomyces sp. NPDC051940]|uniref:hypothetical protein n=1 Tax=Streptomyces sp. NPDC051940 TaxID=3155675 RepID=UPI00343FEFDD
MSFPTAGSSDPWPPRPTPRTSSETDATMSLRLRLAVRVAVVWLAYLAPVAFAPGLYGTPVAGPVSLGLLVAPVPLAVGVHALFAHNRWTGTRRAS